MIKKIFNIIFVIAVVVGIYFGYSYINFDSFSFIVILAGFILLCMTLWQVREATFKANEQIDLITIIMALVFICLFIAFGFIFKSL